MASQLSFIIHRDQITRYVTAQEWLAMQEPSELVVDREKFIRFGQLLGMPMDLCERMLKAHLESRILEECHQSPR